MPPKHEDFLRQAGDEWAASIRSLGLDEQTSATWSDLDAIQAALDPFMGQGKNHAHFPTGGGMDFLSVDRSGENGCLEVITTEKSAEIFKPRLLILEHFPEDPLQSFLLLELHSLLPSGCYDHVIRSPEELVEAPRRNYLRREIWDRGYIGFDEQDNKIGLPEDARLISRWLDGKILLVAHGSLWNSTPETYDGRHNDMTAAQIRSVINRAIGTDM